MQDFVMVMVYVNRRMFMGIAVMISETYVCA